MIGVSERTVKRRLSEYGIKILDTYSHLSDAELDGAIQQIMTSFPDIGYQSVKGHLQSRGERLGGLIPLVSSFGGYPSLSRNDDSILFERLFPCGT